MPSPSLLRALQRRACSARNLPSCRRYASHGHGPQYNEPTGYLFAEKVRTAMLVSHFELTAHLFRYCFEAACTRAKAQEGVLGDCLVCWNVWYHGSGRRLVVLQAGYQVRNILWSLFNPILTISPVNSIQSWALKEAKARMEARGEKPEL